MDFGILSKEVYANDGDGNPAFWTVFSGHVHGDVVRALGSDTAIKVAIQAKLNAPNDGVKRGAVIDLINRATVNCIGQHLVGQALNPEQANFAVYNLLAEGTAAAIDAVLGDAADEDLHNAFAAAKADAIITVISRQTGRALFQTCVSQLVDLGLTPQNIVGKLKAELLNRAIGSVPGI